MLKVLLKKQLSEIFRSYFYDQKKNKARSKGTVIAYMVLFLCSDKAGFITGENICIDGGMTRQMIYHGDHGWTLTSSKAGL